MYNQSLHPQTECRCDEFFCFCVTYSCIIMFFATLQFGSFLLQRQWFTMGTIPSLVPLPKLLYPSIFLQVAAFLVSERFVLIRKTRFELNPGLYSHKGHTFTCLMAGIWNYFPLSVSESPRIIVITQHLTWLGWASSAQSRNQFWGLLAFVVNHISCDTVPTVLLGSSDNLRFRSLWNSEIKETEPTPTVDKICGMGARFLR